jgi:hypothetical protein
MLRLQEPLDDLCTKLGVPKLSDFYDHSELEAMYGDSDEGGEEPGDTWYDPSPALTAVLTIRDHLAQHPEELALSADPSRKHWPSALMDELEHCRSVLQEAASRGERFRFLIVA